MTEFELNYDNERKRLYLKEEVARVFGNDPIKILGLVNAETVLLYPANSDYETILKSLEILRMDLELRRERQKKEANSSTN